MKITFTMKEQDCIFIAGNLRQKFAETYNNSTANQIDKLNALINHIMAIASEWAVSKWIGQDKFSPTFNVHKHLPDVGKLQVRYVQKEDGKLVFRDSDDERQFFVLVKGELPTLEIVGGQWGSLIKNKGELSDPGNKGKPAYFLSQDKLTSPDKILKKIIPTLNDKGFIDTAKLVKNIPLVKSA